MEDGRRKRGKGKDSRLSNVQGKAEGQYCQGGAGEGKGRKEGRRGAAS